MMSYQMTDKEQIQAFKDWWKKNGKVILLGVALFFVLNTTIIYIKNYNAKYKMNASNAYTRLIAAQSENKADEVKLYADDLAKTYSRSIYASLGMLLAAKNAVDAGKLDNALADINWIINKNKNAAITEIAKIRAARILIAQNKPHDALKLLQKINDESFMAAIDEVKGDIEFALQNKAEASKYYQKALDDSVQLEKQSPLLSMKLNTF